MAAPGERDEGYRIDYFFGRSSRGTSLHLFKKVDYPGRSRPEVFVLDGERWVKASGLTPSLAGAPEWSGSASWISIDEAAHIMLTAGLSHSRVKVLLASTEGQRQWPRPEVRSPSAL